MLNFGFLLIMADDAQEWGRKRISELYVKKNSNYEFDSITPSFNTKRSVYKGANGEKEIDIHKFSVREKFKFQKGEKKNLQGILFSLIKQRNGYQEIFRDGQDTAKRNFVFEKRCDIEFEDGKLVKFGVHFVISNDAKPTFKIEVSSAQKKNVEKSYAEAFFKEIYSGYNVSQIEKNEDSAMYEIIADE